MYDNFNPYFTPERKHKEKTKGHPMVSNLKFARAYVPRQPYIGMFPINEALRKGMLFPNLYEPFPIKSME